MTDTLLYLCVLQRDTDFVWPRELGFLNLKVDKSGEGDSIEKPGGEAKTQKGRDISNTCNPHVTETPHLTSVHLTWSNWQCFESLQGSEPPEKWWWWRSAQETESTGEREPWRGCPAAGGRHTLERLHTRWCTGAFVELWRSGPCDPPGQRRSRRDHRWRTSRWASQRQTAPQPETWSSPSYPAPCSCGGKKTLFKWHKVQII